MSGKVLRTQELLAIILSFLDVSTLAACRKVSHDIRAHILASPSLCLYRKCISRDVLRGGLPPSLLLVAHRVKALRLTSISGVYGEPVALNSEEIGLDRFINLRVLVVDLFATGDWYEVPWLSLKHLQELRLAHFDRPVPDADTGVDNVFAQIWQRGVGWADVGYVGVESARYLPPIPDSSSSEELTEEIPYPHPEYYVGPPLSPPPPSPSLPDPFLPRLRRLSVPVSLVVPFLDISPLVTELVVQGLDGWGIKWYQAFHPPSPFKPINYLSGINKIGFYGVEPWNIEAMAPLLVSCTDIELFDHTGTPIVRHSSLFGVTQLCLIPDQEKLFELIHLHPKPSNVLLMAQFLRYTDPQNRQAAPASHSTLHTVRVHFQDAKVSFNRRTLDMEFEVEVEILSKPLESLDVREGRLFTNDHEPHYLYASYS